MRRVVVYAFESTGVSGLVSLFVYNWGCRIARLETKVAGREGSVDLSDDNPLGSERIEEFKAVVLMSFLWRVDIMSSVSAQNYG